MNDATERNRLISKKLESCEQKDPKSMYAESLFFAFSGVIESGEVI